MSSYYNVEPVSLGVNIAPVKAYTFPIKSNFSSSTTFEVAKNLDLNNSLNLGGLNFSANFSSGSQPQEQVTPSEPSSPSTKPYIWKDS